MSDHPMTTDSGELPSGTPDARMAADPTADLTAAPEAAAPQAESLNNILAKFDITGAGAEAFLNRVCANQVPRKIGGIALVHLLSPAGRIQGEMTITRLDDDKFYALSAAAVVANKSQTCRKVSCGVPQMRDTISGV